MENVAGSGGNDVGRGGDGQLEAFGEAHKSVGDAFFASGPDPSARAAVGIKGWANVQAVDAVCVPRLAFGRLLMDEDANARRGNGHAIEIIGAMDLSPSGEFGIEERAME